MRNAVIVDAVRTPCGRRDGMLKDWHPADLAAHVFKAIEARSDIDPAIIDDVIMGCVAQVGQQALNIGRSAVLAAGWPESIPATTVDRQCGSSQQSLHFGAQGVIAGAYDVVVAAGVESMTRVPMGSSTVEEMGSPFPDSVQERYAETGLPGQGVCAEIIADQWGLTREDLDEYAARSQQRAAAATEQGLFNNEIVPVPVSNTMGDGLMMRDEGIRSETTPEILATLKPAFREDGRITAGNASQISDGASATLIMSEQKAGELGLKPRARFHAFAIAGASPATMLTGPIPATRKVLERANMSWEQIDRFEVNEAFASVVLVWQKEIGAAMDRVNVNGGAIAIGHPMGCSGTRLMATLLNELERSGSRYGLQTMCEGGGLANATIIERI